MARSDRYPSTCTSQSCKAAPSALPYHKVAERRSATTGCGSAHEAGHQLHVRRPDELVDRLDHGEAEAAVDERARVAREGRGIARDHDRAPDAGRGERRRLR